MLVDENDFYAVSGAQGRRLVAMMVLLVLTGTIFRADAAGCVARRNLALRAASSAAKSRFY